ncbi:MAG: hypothetical protein ABI599_13810 [Flavobacteriales bacterium]
MFFSRHPRNPLALVCAVAFLFSCSAPGPVSVATPKEVSTAAYQLIRPAEPEALLILFPCFGCDAQDTREESKITDEAAANHVAVMLMNFNRRLFLSDVEMTALVDVISTAVSQNDLAGKRVFLGGFSSGGNVALLLAKRLRQAPEKEIPLAGLFAVDSPLDLSQLYPVWKRHAEHSTVPVAQGESAMVIALLDSTLGNPTDSAANYEVFSPVTPSAASVAPLKDLPVRLYTEPDTAWWRENRGDRYEDLNACYLEKLHKQLVAAGNTRSEFITTQNKGIQHGHRHPHAWSIVDPKDLVQWILAEQH